MEARCGHYRVIALLRFGIVHNAITLQLDNPIKLHFIALFRYHIIAYEPCAQVDNAIKQVANTKSLQEIPILKFCVQISRSRLVLSRYHVIALSRYSVIVLLRYSVSDLCTEIRTFMNVLLN